MSLIFSRKNIFTFSTRCFCLILNNVFLKVDAYTLLSLRQIHRVENVKIFFGEFS